MLLAMKRGTLLRPSIGAVTHRRGRTAGFVSPVQHRYTLHEKSSCAPIATGLNARSRANAEANVIRRREETNATRSLLNTARVMAENQVMLRLKELEALSDIAGKVKSLTVQSGTQGLLHDLVSLQEQPGAAWTELVAGGRTPAADRFGPLAPMTTLPHRGEGSAARRIAT